MKILCVSDKVEDRVYNTRAKDRFEDIDLVISCGDLPYYYLEFITDALRKPVYYVRGNHANKVEYTSSGFGRFETSEDSATRTRKNRT